MFETEVNDQIVRGGQHQTCKTMSSKGKTSGRETMTVLRSEGTAEKNQVHGG